MDLLEKYIAPGTKVLVKPTQEVVTVVSCWRSCSFRTDQNVSIDLTSLKDFSLGIKDYIHVSESNMIIGENYFRNITGTDAQIFISNMRAADPDFIDVWVFVNFGSFIKRFSFDDLIKLEPEVSELFNL